MSHNNFLHLSFVCAAGMTSRRLEKDRNFVFSSVLASFLIEKTTTVSEQQQSDMMLLCYVTATDANLIKCLGA